MSLQDAIALIREAIEQYLGPARAAAMSDGQIVREHLGGGRNFQPANVDAAINGIMSSPEAEAYFKSQQNAPAPGATTPGATPPPATTTPPVAAPGPTTDPFQTRPTPGDFSRTKGYDFKNWGTMESLKYRAGEIITRYPSTPSGLKRAMNDPEFKALFPNAKLIGKDTIDFGGQLSDFTRGLPVYAVDVGENFDDINDTGTAYVWQDQVNTGAGPASTGAGPGFKYLGQPTTPIDPAGVGLPAPPDATGAIPPDPRNIGGPPQTQDPAGAAGSSIGMSQFLQQAYGQAAPGAQRNPYDLSMAEYLSRLSQARNQRIGQIGGV